MSEYKKERIQQIRTGGVSEFNKFAMSIVGVAQPDNDVSFLIRLSFFENISDAIQFQEIVFDNLKFKALLKPETALVICKFISSLDELEVQMFFMLNKQFKSGSESAYICDLVEQSLRDIISEVLNSCPASVLLTIIDQSIDNFPSDLARKNDYIRSDNDQRGNQVFRKNLLLNAQT